MKELMNHNQRDLEPTEPKEGESHGGVCRKRALKMKARTGGERGRVIRAEGTTHRGLERKVTAMAILQGHKDKRCG